MTVPYRPITRIELVVKAVGLEISYAYDDLVFVDHSAFLLRMGAEGKDVIIHFNEESLPEERPAMAHKIIEAGKNQELSISVGSLFSLKQKEGEELELTFDKD